MEGFPVDKKEIKRIFKRCILTADNGNENKKCWWPCSSCNLSNRYEKEMGIRIEDLANADAEMLTNEEIQESNI